MISSSHRSPKLKDLAEVLAMIADTHHETPIRHTQTVREADEWESATEFCAALDRLVEGFTEREAAVLAGMSVQGLALALRRPEVEARLKEIARSKLTGQLPLAASTRPSTSVT